MPSLFANICPTIHSVSSWTLFYNIAIMIARVQKREEKRVSRSRKVVFVVQRSSDSLLRIVTLHNTLYSETVLHAWDFAQPASPADIATAHNGLCRRLWSCNLAGRRLRTIIMIVFCTSKTVVYMCSFCTVQHSLSFPFMYPCMVAKNEHRSFLMIMEAVQSSTFRFHRTRTSGCYAEYYKPTSQHVWYFPEAGQECIDSTTGRNSSLDPTTSLPLSIGRMYVLALFSTPSRSQVPGTMGIKWLAQGHNSRQQLNPQPYRIGSLRPSPHTSLWWIPIVF